MYKEYIVLKKNGGGSPQTGHDGRERHLKGGEGRARGSFNPPIPLFY